jgi:hypothetical protein
MTQYQSKLSLVRGTGLVAAVLILAGAISTALQPSSNDQQTELAPQYTIESAAVRQN